MGDVVFYLMEQGHSRNDVLSYPIQFLQGYIAKKNETTQKESKPTNTTAGNRKSTTMTSQQALAKVRARGK